MYYYSNENQLLPYPCYLADYEMAFVVMWVKGKTVIGQAGTFLQIKLSRFLGIFSVRAAVNAGISKEQLQEFTVRLAEVYDIKKHQAIY